LLKQFAPSVSSPPSPKNNALNPQSGRYSQHGGHWSQHDRQQRGADRVGRCPSRYRMLNIINTNEKAEKSASTGTVRAVSVLRTRLTAVAQNGVDAAYITPQVTGLR